MTGFQFREVEVERTPEGLVVEGEVHQNGSPVGRFIIGNTGPIGAGIMFTSGVEIDDATSQRLLLGVFTKAVEHDRQRAREEVLRN